MSQKRKFIISLLVTAIVLSGLLIFPGLASGFTVTLQRVGEGSLGGSTYLLGEWISFSGEVDFPEGEEVTVKNINFVVAGPEPFTKELPVEEGTYTEDRFIVTVTWTNITAAGNGYGYDYGYGYSFKGGMGGGSINYEVKWRPSYLLTKPTPELPMIDIAWQVPSVSGLVEDRRPQGIASDGTNLYLLVDGTSTDIIVKTDTEGNVLSSFNAPSKDTRAITYLDGNLYVYADNYQRIIKVTNETATYSGWGYQYNLSISSDYNKQLVDRNGDGVVDAEDITVTVNGQPAQLSSVDVWSKNFTIDETTIWDRAAVRAPTVVKVGNTYHMWYYSDAGQGTNESKIGHATSSDGKSWTKDLNNPVLTPGEPGAWDEAGVFYPSVVYDSSTSTFHMWYTGDDSSDVRQVGHATSPDGTNWTKDANPVFSPSTAESGAWDEQIFDMDVIASGSSYEMWYSAAGPTEQKAYVAHIGHATSADGINWTRDAKPVLAPSDWDWDWNGLFSPTVVKEGSTYYMWFMGKGWGYYIGRAVSTDGGKTWKKDTTYVLSPGMGSDFDNYFVDGPDVIKEADGYRMWYEGGDWSGRAAIGRATSSLGNKGVNWTKYQVKNITTPVLNPGIEGAEVLASYWYSPGYAQNSIIKIDADDGSYVTHYSSPWSYQVGGLTTDGNSLYGISSLSNDVWEIDPDDGFVLQNKSFWSYQYSWYGSDALAYQDGKLYAGKGSLIFELNWDTGNVVDTYDTGLEEELIQGLELIGNTLYIGVSTSNVGTIYKGALPGTGESTAIGDYKARLQVVNGGTTTSAAVPFTLQKLTEPVEVTITEPLDGQAFFTPEIAIKGKVNDSSIDYVQVGIELPMTVLIEDDMEKGDSDKGEGAFQKQDVDGMNKDWWVSYSEKNLWHLTELRANSGKYSWAYSREMGAAGVNYDTPGKANAGAIVSQPFTIGEETELSFWTAWDTDSGPDWDRKLIDIYVDGKWQPLAYIVDGEWYWDPYTGTREMLVIPMAWMAGPGPGPMPGPSGWNWYEATIDLNKYKGEEVQIRFRFDSWDSWSNWFQGWYIDDVKATGAGFKGVEVPVINLQFSTTYTLAEGDNTITVSAQSGYIPGDEGKDSKTVTVSLDSTTPIVTLDTLPECTKEGSVTVSGTVYEKNFDNLVLTINDKPFYTLRDVPSGQSAPQWTFSQPVALFEGENEIVVTVTDIPGLTGSDSATVIRDSTPPTIVVLDTVYPIGKVSARAKDLFILQVNAADASSGVGKVELQLPDGKWERFIPANELPEAIRDQWGTTGAYLFPMIMPEEAPPGAYSFTAKVTDKAGMETTKTISALVAPTLSAYNIYLMPEWNLISLPLIPDDSDIADLLGTVTGVKSVWYYNAATATWSVYTPGEAPDNLLTMETGKGYWVDMDKDEFKYSAPLAPGLPQTPAPIPFSYTGKVLEPATVPPTYKVEEGWNLIGLHSERGKLVTLYLRPVSVPEEKWAALLQYDNYIKFKIGDEEEKGKAEIYLGCFRTLLETDEMEPARGFWLYMVEPGNLVAQP